jgi:hypothetical protein
MLRRTKLDSMYVSMYLRRLCDVSIYVRTQTRMRVGVRVCTNACTYAKATVDWVEILSS